MMRSMQALSLSLSLFFSLSLSLCSEPRAMTNEKKMNWHFNMKIAHEKVNWRVRELSFELWGHDYGRCRCRGGCQRLWKGGQCYNMVQLSHWKWSKCCRHFTKHWAVNSVLHLLPLWAPGSYLRLSNCQGSFLNPGTQEQRNHRFSCWMTYCDILVFLFHVMLSAMLGA